MIDPTLPRRSQEVQQRLHELGVSADVQELPDSTRTAVEAAEALGCEVGAIASSLLFLADEEPLLIMTSGAHRVDPPTVAEAIGATTVAQATAKQVRAVTGQAIGGVAPVGHPQRIRTVVDESLAAYETVWAAAGTPHTVMPLTFAELVAITSGAVIAVAP